MSQIPCADEAAWLAERRNGIGASEAAIILGLSTYKSPFQLYHEKLGLEVESKANADARTFGLLFEEPIAQYYALETKREVRRVKPYTLFRDDAHPFMLATPDRFVRVPERSPYLRPLELKMADVSLRTRWADEPPLEYVVQVQHQMAVTGADFASLAAVIGGNSFLWCDLERDDEFINRLRAILGEWWTALERHEPPPIDGTEATRNTLKALYAQESGDVIALPTDAIEWDQQLEALRAAGADERRGRETEQHRYENLIINALGNASAGTLPNGIVYTYKTTKREGYMVAATQYRALRRKGTLR